MSQKQIKKARKLLKSVFIENGVKPPDIQDLKELERILIRSREMEKAI